MVAGGGLAGAAAAVGLAQAGLAVTLIERETQPVDKICGEFLSTEAQEYLSRLGLDVTRLSGAAISRLRLVRGAKTVQADLPFSAIGLSRRKLDEALLRHAQDAGVQVLRGHSVRRISIKDKIALEIEGLGTATPDILMLATGKHELRGIKREFSPTIMANDPSAHPRPVMAALDAAIHALPFKSRRRHDSQPRLPGVSPSDNKKNLIGFKMYFRLRAAARASLQDHIELIFFPGGYAGLQMIENGIANLCLLVDRDRYRLCGGNWENLLAYLKTSSAVLADQLTEAEPLLAQPLTIYQVPYGFIHQPRAGDPPGLFRLGDQACVIHSFTGDGMSIALHSAMLAVRAVLEGKDGNSFHRQLAADVRGQMKRADAIYTLMNNPATQAASFKISCFWPGSLKIAARLTRVPVQARQEGKDLHS
jgi:flavin-dependent dehydrogenase